MKQGIWFSWHSNGTLEKKEEWKNDRYEGIFQIWYRNGKAKAIGQTLAGEVDGEWMEFYKSGQLANHSNNELGILVSIQVWKPDGRKCMKSHLLDETGKFFQYDENGSVCKERVFRSGIELKSTE